MKKILFVLCLVATTLFYSCRDDEENTDTPRTETEIVQNGIKNKFYNTNIEAYEFINGTEVNVWADIIENGKYYQYLKGTFQIYSEKQYIVVKTTSKEILLYYKVENNKVYLYTDADKINNIPNTTKPNDFTNESKEPNNNNNDGEIILTTINTIVDFDTWEYQSINNDRLMYIKDSKTNQTILTLTWRNLRQIKHFTEMSSSRNLVGYYPNYGYIKGIKNSEGTSLMVGDNESVSVKLYKIEKENNITTIFLKIDIDNANGKVNGYISFPTTK